MIIPVTVAFFEYTLLKLELLSFLRNSILQNSFTIFQIESKHGQYNK